MCSSSVLWNEVMEEVGRDFPEVQIKHILVDAAATYLCLNPGQFDVMVMENMFGDILSDQEEAFCPRPDAFGLHGAR